VRLPAAWIELLDVFAGLTRFADDPVECLVLRTTQLSVCLDDQILVFSAQKKPRACRDGSALDQAAGGAC
jgi:hypothetical protein